MYRNSPAWAGWASFILAVLMVVAFVPSIYSFFTATNDEDFSRAPVMSYAQIFSEAQTLSEIKTGVYNEGYQAPLGAPADYYRVAIRDHRLDAAERRFEHDHPKQAGTTEWRMLRVRYSVNDLTQLQSRYENHYGLRTMQDVAFKLRPWMDAQEQSFAIGTKPEAYDGAGRLFVRGYVCAALLSVLFFMARLKQNDMLIWPEIVNLRLFGAALGIFGFAFVYPSRINPVEQAKRAWRFVCALCAGVVSMSAMATVANAGERKGEDGGQSNVLTLSDLPVPKISFTGGIENAKVTGNGTRVNNGLTYTMDWNFAFQNGWGFDVWASQQAKGVDSNEVDYTVTKTVHSTMFGVGYYDLVPEGSGRGDMVNPFVTTEWPLWHGVKAFTKADAYIMTGDHHQNDGFDITLGVKGAVPTKLATFNQSLGVVEAGGPFGQKLGTSLRFDEQVAVPLNKRLQLLFNLKAFVPFAGARDRGRDISGGVSFAYAFN